MFLESISSNSGKVFGRGRQFPFFHILWLGLFLLFRSMTSEPAFALTSIDNGWFIDMDRFSASAHGSFSCETCHGEMAQLNEKHAVVKKARSLLTDVDRYYDYSRCKACHRESYKRYLLGEHAKALKEEHRRLATGSEGEIETRAIKAPTCGDCHSAHYVKSHLSKVEMGKKMTEVCGSCHLPQKLTYLENYHGKAAVNLGNTAAAYCTDCHGAHDCISLKDKKAALVVCKRCHPQATEKFSQFIIHPTMKGLARDSEAKKARVALIKAVTIIMMIIVILIVAFFYSHTFVWLLRELHEKLRKH